MDLPGLEVWWWKREEANAANSANAPDDAKKPISYLFPARPGTRWAHVFNHIYEQEIAAGTPTPREQIKVRPFFRANFSTVIDHGLRATRAPLLLTTAVLVPQV